MPPLDLPPDALVILVGPSGAGKSTWAAARFPRATILSSDDLRSMVSGDPGDQTATADAFKVLHLVARARLRRGLLTVIDATNLTVTARHALLRLARAAGRPCTAVVFDITLERCLAHNVARHPRQVPAEVVRRQHRELQAALARLPEEGYRAIHIVGERDSDPT